MAMDRIQKETIILALPILDGDAYARSSQATSDSMLALMGIKTVEIPYKPDPKVEKAFAILKKNSAKKKLEQQIALDQKKKKKYGKPN